MTISLVAFVGADANIGSVDELPAFLDREDRDKQSLWFDKLSENTIVLLGSNTIRLMKKAGWSGPGSSRYLAVWTRKMGLTPEVFIERLQKEGRHILVAGGARTFKIFAPFCENYYLRRVNLMNKPDFRLDPVFSAWQPRYVNADTEKVPRLS